MNDLKNELDICIWSNDQILYQYQNIDEAKYEFDWFQKSLKKYELLEMNG